MLVNCCWQSGVAELLLRDRRCDVIGELGLLNCCWLAGVFQNMLLSWCWWTSVDELVLLNVCRWLLLLNCCWWDGALQHILMSWSWNAPVMELVLLNCWCEAYWCSADSELMLFLNWWGWAAFFERLTMSWCGWIVVMSWCCWNTGDRLVLMKWWWWAVVAEQLHVINLLLCWRWYDVTELPVVGYWCSGVAY